MAGASLTDRRGASLEPCAMCGRDLITVSEWSWEYAGRILRFCSQRCEDRFRVDPARRIIVSPRRQA